MTQAITKELLQSIPFTSAGHLGLTAPGEPLEWHYANAPCRAWQAHVCKVSGLRHALYMPPPLMAALARIYGEGGHPCHQVEPGVWRMDTPLCRALFTDITWEGLRMRVLIVGKPDQADRRAVLFDKRVVFAWMDSMARQLTARQASEAAGLPLLFTEAAIREATGTTPRDDETFNGIALWVCLIAYCKRQRDLYRHDKGKDGQDKRALWDSRAARIERTKGERWCLR